LKGEDPEKTIQPDVIQTIVSERTAQRRIEDESKDEEGKAEKAELIKRIKMEKSSVIFFFNLKVENFFLAKTC
jgi:hypothetical protein